MHPQLGANPTGHNRASFQLKMFETVVCNFGEWGTQWEQDTQYNTYRVTSSINTCDTFDLKASKETNS